MKKLVFFLALAIFINWIRKRFSKGFFVASLIILPSDLCSIFIYSLLERTKQELWEKIKYLEIKLEICCQRQRENKYISRRYKQLNGSCNGKKKKIVWFSNCLRGEHERAKGNLSLMGFDKNDKISGDLTDVKNGKFQWHKRKATYHVFVGWRFCCVLVCDVDEMTKKMFSWLQRYSLLLMNLPFCWLNEQLLAGDAFWLKQYFLIKGQRCYNRKSHYLKFVTKAFC